jgi:hypothetical protein
MMRYEVIKSILAIKDDSIGDVDNLIVSALVDCERLLPTWAFEVSTDGVDMEFVDSHIRRGMVPNCVADIFDGILKKGSNISHFTQKYFFKKIPIEFVESLMMLENEFVNKIKFNQSSFTFEMSDITNRMMQVLMCVHQYIVCPYLDNLSTFEDIYEIIDVLETSNFWIRPDCVTLRIQNIFRHNSADFLNTLRCTRTCREKLKTKLF